jgi:hypothetical protein
LANSKEVGPEVNAGKANSKVGPEVNAEKTKYMLLSRRQNAGKNHDMKTANRYFENVAQLKYFGMAVTNQNLI